MPCSPSSTRWESSSSRFACARRRLFATSSSCPDSSSWRTVRLDRQGAYRSPEVVDEVVRISDYPKAIRQLVVRGLGRESPTVILTNDTVSSTKTVIERYAGRMTIEQRLGESIRAFHLDALSSAVPLNVDLDVVLSVLAGAVCASLRRRLTGYHCATPAPSSAASS